MKFKNIPLLVIGAYITIVLSQCVPPGTQEQQTDFNFDLKDKTLQTIHNLQDRHSSDSLLKYFTDPNPTYRYSAVLAFASFKDSTALPQLAKMFKDDIEGVRLAAAYAIGQQKTSSSEKILTDAFLRNDSLMTSQKFNAAILEALGKSASPEALKAIASVTTYTKNDTVLLEGQAMAIYRFATRGIAAQEGTNRMLQYVSDNRYPARVRKIAAHYLTRAKDINLGSDSITNLLMRALEIEPDNAIRLPLTAAIGKTKNLAILNPLTERLQHEKDYRIQCNILKALANLPYDTVKTVFYNALNNANYHVATTASRFFAEHGIAKESGDYWAKAKEPRHWQVQLSLYEAALKYMSNTYIEYKQLMSNELKSRLTASKNYYEQAATIKTLAAFGWNYPIIKQISYPSNIPIIRTAGVEALASIATDPDFFAKFRESSNAVKKQLRDYFAEAIYSNDVGMIASAAAVLRDDKANFKPFIADSLFADALTAVQAKLQLPRDIEAFNELQQTVNYFKNINTPQTTPAYNHPIDWLIFTSIGDSTIAEVQTTKGKFSILLFQQAAPSTVANFIKLARANFFNNKTFHRVVTNFVIQTGCPRGDGYGSLEYTIRSELSPLHYEEGMVGMASAGNDTECSQWFVNTQATPHLDGNYTIFGKVIAGMSVVHAIEIGDIIQKVTIVDK